MGGLSYGIYTPYFVNSANPASLAAFDTLSFVFDAGIHARQVSLSTTRLTQTANYASLGNLSFGFPVTGWWKSSISLNPYSMTGYKVVDAQTDPFSGRVNFLYEGTGGINQLSSGNSFKIAKGLSIGVQAGYLFGTLNKTSATEFPDSLLKINYKINTSAQVHDFYFNYGLFYHKLLSNGIDYNLGMVFSNQTNINISQNRFGYTYFKSATGVDLTRDTIVNTEAEKGVFIMPMNAGFGFSLGKADKWLAGAEIQYQQWEKYAWFGVNDSLKNSLRVSAGGSYTPSYSTVSSYWQRITYRGGLRYNQSYLELRNTRINEFGISIGVGLPLPRTRSTVNLAAEFGSRGSKSNNLIKENFVKFTLGLSIFERWFIIRKYD